MAQKLAEDTAFGAVLAASGKVCHLMNHREVRLEIGWVYLEVFSAYGILFELLMYLSWDIYIYIIIYLGYIYIYWVWPPPRMPVTTKIPFLVFFRLGDSRNKPAFTTGILGSGGHTQDILAFRTRQCWGQCDHKFPRPARVETLLVPTYFQWLQNNASFKKPWCCMGIWMVKCAFKFE